MNTTLTARFSVSFLSQHAPLFTTNPAFGNKPRFLTSTAFVTNPASRNKPRLPHQTSFFATKLFPATNPTFRSECGLHFLAAKPDFATMPVFLNGIFHSFFATNPEFRRIPQFSIIPHFTTNPLLATSRASRNTTRFLQQAPLLTKKRFCKKNLLFVFSEPTPIFTTKTTFWNNLRQGRIS